MLRPLNGGSKLLVFGMEALELRSDRVHRRAAAHINEIGTIIFFVLTGNQLRLHGGILTFIEFGDDAVSDRKSNGFRILPGSAIDGVGQSVARENSMANDELGNRKILNSAFDFTAPRRGPNEMYALNSALPVLANAIAEAADLFEQFDGRTVVLADGALQIVTSALLASTIRANLVRKGVRNVGTAEAPKLERAYVPVAVGEGVLRLLLQDEKHGLPGRLPVLRPEDLAPQADPSTSAQEAAEAPAVAMTPETETEIAAGQRASARHAAMGDVRLREEREAGARAAAKYQN
jgi:hypothetical protein